MRLGHHFRRHARIQAQRAMTHTRTPEQHMADVAAATLANLHHTTPAWFSV